MSTMADEHWKNGLSRETQKTLDAAPQAAADLTNQAATAVSQQADDLAASAGAGLQHLGKLLESQAPHAGMLGNASQVIAQKLQETGEFLEETSVGEMMSGLTQLIRRNPFPAVVIGLGVGLLLGRVMRR